MLPCPIKKLSLSILAGLLIAGVSAPAIHAQQAESPSFSLTVSPPRHEMTLNPGEKVQKAVKVTNTANIPLTVKALVIDYIVRDDNGTPMQVRKEEAGRYAASLWFTPEQNEVTIDAKSTAIVNVVIEAPKEAIPGGHYAGVYFEPVIAHSTSKSVSYTNPQVGSIFVITIPGDVKQDAFVKEFKTDKDVYEFGPVDFTAAIENQGDIHVSPKGQIEVKDMLGRTVASLPLTELNIFPYTSRSYQARWDQTWGFGRYSATLNAAYGNGKVATATILFWIMPYRVIGAIGILILVLIALFILIRRHLLHRADASKAEVEALKRRIAELENKDRQPQY